VTTIFFSVCFDDVSLCFHMEDMPEQTDSQEPNHARLAELQDSKLASPRSRVDWANEFQDPVCIIGNNVPRAVCAHQEGNVILAHGAEEWKRLKISPDLSTEEIPCNSTGAVASSDHRTPTRSDERTRRAKIEWNSVGQLRRFRFFRWAEHR
jgi:hypothetical protein